MAASIKAQKPEWRISWVVKDIFSPLVRACSAVDQIYVFRRHEGTRGFVRLMREIRKQEFDVVCDFQALLRTGLMTKWTRAPEDRSFRCTRRRRVLLQREDCPAARGAGGARAGDSAAVLPCAGG